MRSIAAAPHIFWAVLFIILPLLIVATVTTVIVMAVSGCTAQALINRSERKEDRDAE